MSDFKFKNVDLSERQATLFYFSWAEMFRELDGDSAKRMILAIADYSMSGGQIEPDFSESTILRILFAQVRSQIDHDIVTYVQSSLKNQLNIRIRWNKNAGKADYDGIEDYDVPGDVQKHMLKELAKRYLATGSYTTEYDRIDPNSTVNDPIRPNTTITDTDTDMGIVSGFDTKKETGINVGTVSNNDADQIPPESPYQSDSTEQTGQTKIDDSVFKDISLDKYFSGRLPTEEEFENCLVTEIFGDKNSWVTGQNEYKRFKAYNDRNGWKKLSNGTVGELVKSWILADNSMKFPWYDRIVARRQEEEVKAETAKNNADILTKYSAPRYAELLDAIRDSINQYKSSDATEEDVNNEIAMKLSCYSGTDLEDDERLRLAALYHEHNGIRHSQPRDEWAESVIIDHIDDEGFHEFKELADKLTNIWNRSSLEERLFELERRCKTIEEELPRIREEYQDMMSEEQLPFE